MWRDTRKLVNQRSRGQIMIIVAIMMVVLVGFVAVAVDVGYAAAEHRQVQSAVDSAALAAAQEAMDSASSGQIVSAAKAYGAENASVSTDNVTVDYPPTNGPHKDDKNFIQVTITKDVERFFTGVVYNGPWKVTATATAGVVGASSDAALLALNSNSGGIKTAGSSTINVIGGSVVSNYDINTSGNTHITADQWVTANDGFHTSGSTTITGGSGTNPAAPEVPDPLKDKISPPTLPDFPVNPIANVNPATQACISKPGWSGQKSADYSASSGTYVGSGCINIYGSTITGYDTFNFAKGSYKLTNGGSMTSSFGKVNMNGGTWIFNGGAGLAISNPDDFEMYAGNYAFLGGATISMQGNVKKVALGTGATKATDNYFYFTGGGGITVGGGNSLVLYPGTYIFDGGPGLSMSGNVHLTFKPGTYKFYFDKGAGISFSGGSTIISDPDAYVQAWFLGSSSQSSNLAISGNTDFSIPSGEYYFDYGNFTGSGSLTISGTNVFLYFEHKSALTSSGNAKFGFTAPTTKIYPGYYPGVFMYANANDTQTFTWTGATSTVSQGAIYLPSAKVVMTGASNGKVMIGQFIANSFDLSGNNSTTLEYKEYVSTATPKVYLVQ